MKKMFFLSIIFLFLYSQSFLAMNIEKIKNPNDDDRTYHFSFQDPFDLDWEQIAIMSASEIFTYLKSKNVDIPENSYVSHALHACQIIDDIFKNPQPDILQKLYSYEDLLTTCKVNNEENIFLKQVNKFLYDPTSLFNQENFVGKNKAQKTKTNISDIVAAFCFTNYIYNPFAVKKPFSITFHKKNGDLSIVFGNNYACFDNEKYIVYANKFGYKSFRELTKVFKKENGGIKLTRLQKNGLFNLFRHYVPKEGKGLLLGIVTGDIQKNYKNISLLSYQHFLKPLVAQALHPSFSNISLLEEAFRHCMFYALDNKGNMLLHLDNLALKLHQDSHTNLGVKKVCQSIRSDIAKLFHADEPFVSHLSFWAATTRVKQNHIYVEERGSHDFTQRAEFILKQNGFYPSERLKLEYLKNPNFDFRSVFRHLYNLPKNSNHEYSKELDEYFEQSISSDPIVTAEKQYKRQWWRQLWNAFSELGQKHAAFLLPKLQEFASEHFDWFTREEDPEEQLQIQQLKKYNKQLEELFYDQYCKNSFRSQQFFKKKQRAEQFYYNVGLPIF